LNDFDSALLETPTLELKMKAHMIFLTAFLNTPTALYGNVSLPAFPGAEGGGAISIGGRGGVVCTVSNLNDSGPGSLRACINASGPRTVVFRVGGTIQVKSEMAIINPYITIAGQTAPGGGIQLTGTDLCGERGWDQMIRVRTHDVIASHLRIRKGACPSDSKRATPIGVGYSGKNAIFDHLSVYWSEGMNFGVYAHSWSGQSADNAPKNITLSNSILAEPLGTNNHTQLGVGGVEGRGDWMLGMTDIDFHNNMFLNFNHRGPTNSARSGRLVNNIIYNWGFYATQIASGVQYDVVSNIYKTGPNNVSSTQPEITSFLYSDDNRFINDAPSIYVSGNKGPSLVNPDDDNWGMVWRVSGMNGGLVSRLSTAYRRTSPLPAPAVPITVRHVNDLENHLLPRVGASRRLDCSGNWVDNRDEADARVVNWYQNRRGGRVNHEDEVGGIPAVASGAACLDSDGDGMPDAWEDLKGLDKNDPSDRNALHLSGFTMLEIYLFGPALTDFSNPPLSPSAIQVE
jgi:hypothetical protein